MTFTLNHESPFNPERVVQLSPLAHLTPRQCEIAIGIATGKSKREVAEENGIAVSTVKSHVHFILSHLGLKSRRDLSLALLKSGVIDCVVWTRDPYLVARLTPRQLSVLRVMSNPRMTYEDGGVVLGLSPSTIKGHVSRICEALGVASREELSAKYGTGEAI